MNDKDTTLIRVNNIPPRTMRAADTDRDRAVERLNLAYS